MESWELRIEDWKLKIQIGTVGEGWSTGELHAFAPRPIEPVGVLEVRAVVEGASVALRCHDASLIHGRAASPA